MSEKVGRRNGRMVIRSHPAIFLILTFTICVGLSLCFSAQDRLTSLLQSSTLAAAGLAAMLIYRPETLNRHRQPVQAYAESPHQTSMRRQTVGVVEKYIAILGLAWSIAIIATTMGGHLTLGQGWGTTLIVLIAICLFTGIAEECLFRGVLFGILTEGLADRRDGVLMAAAISAVVFGLMHVTSGWTMAAESGGIGVAGLVFWFVQAVCFGFIMCALYVKAGNLWHPILAHAAYDLLALFPSAFATGIPTATFLPEGVAGVIMLAISAALMAALVPWAKRAVSPGRGNAGVPHGGRRDREHRSTQSALESDGDPAGELE